MELLVFIIDDKEKSINDIVTILLFFTNTKILLTVIFLIIINLNVSCLQY